VRSLLVPLAVIATLLLVGCEAPIVGDWRSDKKLGNGKRNKLHVWDDYTGQAIIYATPAYDPLTWVKFDFDIAWEDETEQFDLHMDCDDGPCDGDDFTMECEVVDEGDDKTIKLNCKANKKWKDYPLDWEEDLPTE
jgi:hypothetical protein